MKEHARQQALLNKLVHIFDSSKDGLWYMGLDNTVQFYNSNFYGQFDLPLENSILDDWIRLIHPQDRAMFGYCVQSHKEGDTIREVCQYRALTRTGQYVWIEATGIMVTEGDETYMVGCHRDISQQKLLNEYLTHATYHNSETGLFNRKKWVDDIGASSQSGSGVVFAVSIAHLNHYQRRWGAKAIQGVVATITECLRSFHSHQYEIYRISSDVFVVWYHSAINDEFISCVGESLRGAFFSESLSDGVVSGNDVAIGIVHEQDFADQEPVSLLLKTVEYAHTHERISTYHGEVKNSIDRFFTVTDVLNDAIEGDQINIVLQPIVDPVDDKIFSFEALARWTHPELGGITPDEFIPIAEQQGLISALGLSVLCKACVFLVNYDQTHTDKPFVNVNVSVVQLLDGQFAEQAESIVRNQGLEPDRIVFEITESHLLDFEKRSVEQLHTLKRRGFHLSLDDFGAGLSSLTSLFRLPLSQIKIDKELVWESLSSASCRDFIAYLVRHCQSHNIQLVAEGIETMEMQRALTCAGVSLLQGFGIYRPADETFWMDHQVA